MKGKIIKLLRGYVILFCPHGREGFLTWDTKKYKPYRKWLMKLTTLKLHTYIHKRYQRQGKENHKLGRDTCSMKGLLLRIN